MLNRISLKILLIFIAGIVLFNESSSLSAQEQKASEEEIYELILEVRQGRETLSLTFPSLDTNGKFYIPISELADIVKFKTNIDVEAGIAEGFFITEDNSYQLNIHKNTLTLKEQETRFQSGEVFISQHKYGGGDIYVTPGLLNKIWPLDLSLDPLKQILYIKNENKFTSKTSSKRKIKINNFLSKQEEKNTPLNLKKIDNPYQLFSSPVLDLSLISRYRKQDSRFENNINVNGRNDLLKSQANYNFNITQENGESINLNNARFFLEHQNHDNTLPFNLQLAQLGDIRPRTSRLIQGSLTGRGALLSTESTKQIRDFDEITVEGEAEPGWEAELYRNNELIGFQIVSDIGEYRFENIVLNFNKNIIRTVLYGPEGQVREVSKEYNISNQMLSPGKTAVEASILDSNENLISLNNDIERSFQGFTQNFKIKRGINSWLSSFGTFTTIPTEQDTKNYATLGFDFSALGTSNSLEIYKDLSGGEALDFRTAANLMGVNLNLRTSIFSNFESNFSGFGDNRTTFETQLTANKSLKSKLGNIGLRFRANHEEKANNTKITQLDFSENIYKKNLTVTNTNSINLLNNTHQRSDGRLSATYRINKNLQSRSLLNYKIFPEKSVTNILSELRYKHNKKLTSAIDIDYNLQNKETQITNQIAYDFDKFRTSFNVDWSNQTGLSSFLRLSLSLAPYGKDNKYISSSKNLSNQVSLNSKVFLDKNYNKKFDYKDELIEGAIIKVGQRETPKSNQDGYTDYVGANKNEYENITLDLDSIDDPYIISGIDGYNAVLRPASSTSLDFPVFQTGLIDGFIFSENEAVSQITIELLKNNKIVKTTSSTFDGYYSFEYLTPDNYTVRISPSHEEIIPAYKSILMSSDDLLFYDTNFNISLKTEEEWDTEITQNHIGIILSSIKGIKTAYK